MDWARILAFVTGMFPRSANPGRDGPVQCRERLGGLLRYYHQEAA
jgi:putative transposase